MNNIERQRILRAKLDSGDDQDLFQYGACHFLALEIHLQTNFPLRCSSTHGKIAHVWCSQHSKEKTGIDACGIRDENKIVEPGWDLPQDMTLMELEVAIRELGIGSLETELRNRARSFIANNLKSASTSWQNPATLTPDAENRDPQETRRRDERSAEPCFLPIDVARAIHRAESSGAAGFRKAFDRTDTSKAQRQVIVDSGLLPRKEFPQRSSIDLQGTEHVVRFCGLNVEKHQKADAWHPMLTTDGKICVGRALPTEYLRRLELQNRMFGDRIRITALTRGDRFVTTQPTLRGDEPSENEIRDVLESVGWQRIPIGLQDLPVQLMGTAWWHGEEELVLIDARKPNFKKTDFGVLPIDLILADLSEEMRGKFDAKSSFRALASKGSTKARSGHP